MELSVLGGYQLLFAIGAAAALTLLSVVVYNVWFHPLASYPGPLLARCSRLWYVINLVRGTLPFDVHRAHEKYGCTVRIAPDELSYIKPEAWKDVYGHRAGRGEVPKDPRFYGGTAFALDSIFFAPGPRHGHFRRLLSHGFSERSMKDQESIIQEYARTGIQKLHELCQEGRQPVDMVSCYNFFTFDVVGDLAFGKSFGSLEQFQYHPWITFILNINKSSSFLRAVGYYPTLKLITRYFIPKSLIEARKRHGKLTTDMAVGRWERKKDRPDLVSRMVAEGSGVTLQEFIANSSTLAVAGSDTTATVLSGVTYHLVQNPEKLSKLTQEIRSAFASDDEINIHSVFALKYMLACLDETMRIYPPVPGNLPRKTVQAEQMACGLVPANTTISVFNYAQCHSSEHFSSPDEFIPERWLGDPAFENDRIDAVQPFSYGPRNCLGRKLVNSAASMQLLTPPSLAYFEMRLFLARILFHFDLEKTPECEGWTNQEAYNLYIKKPLMVRLRPVEKASKSEA